MVLSISEGVITQILYPNWDPFNYITVPYLREMIIALGLVMMIAGHYLRINAEMTAGRNFNHQIRFRKDEAH